MLSKKFKGNFVLTCILFITIFIALIGDSAASEHPKTASSFSHKIFISGNANLDAFVAGNGTTGLTLENAHVIENFTIQTGTQDYGVFIQNVDRYLILRNCTISVTGSEFSAKPGIEIRLSTNIIVENCAVSSHKLGIQFLDSHYSILRDSMITGNTEAGVRLFESDHNTLLNNTVTLNEGFGIHLKRSHENTVANNTITENTDLGIYDRGDNNIFENNTCDPSTELEIFSKTWLWVVLGIGGAVVCIGGLMLFLTWRGSL